MTKILITILFLGCFSIHSFSQYIGFRYLDKTSVRDGYYDKIYDFDGNIVLEFKNDEIPYFSSFLLKKFDFENLDFSI